MGIERVVLLFLYLGIVIQTEACPQLVAARTAPPLPWMLDVSSVDLHVLPRVHVQLSSLGFDESSLIRALQSSLRAPLQLRGDGVNRYLTYLDPAGGHDTRYRVELTQNPGSNDVTVTYFSRYSSTRDQELVQKFAQMSPVRSVPFPFRITYRALTHALSRQITLQEISEALAAPLAPPIPRRDAPDELWFMGLTQSGHALTFALQRDGKAVPLVLNVASASAEARRSFYTAVGNQERENNAVVETVKPQRGLYALKTITYGAGILWKIKNQHDVTEVEVIEAFERTLGQPVDVEENTAISGAGDRDPRRWIAAQLESGRYIKVVMAIRRDGSLVIISAYEIDARRYRVYTTLARVKMRF